jgi:hypothetical protein
MRKREKGGEGKREKEEGRREKGEGRREKGEGRRESGGQKEVEGARTHLVGIISYRNSGHRARERRVFLSISVAR